MLQIPPAHPLKWYFIVLRIDKMKTALCLIVAIFLIYTTLVIDAKQDTELWSNKESAQVTKDWSLDEIEISMNRLAL